MSVLRRGQREEVDIEEFHHLPVAEFDELGEVLLSLPGVNLGCIDADGVLIDAYDCLTFRD